MNDEDGGDEYGGGQEEEDPWNEDSRKAYAKRMIKESKDLPAHFRKPDYKANMSSAPEPESAPVSEKAEDKEEAPRPREKKKEEYEL